MTIQSIEQYINTQAAFNQSLRVAEHNHHAFTLFASMFDSYLELEREHIGFEPELPFDNTLQSIRDNTLTLVHTKAELSDYMHANQMNAALYDNRLSDFKLLLNTCACALSEHDDPHHINDEVLANCPLKAQQHLKERQAHPDFPFEDERDTKTAAKPELLFDVLEQLKKQQEAEANLT